MTGETAQPPRWSARRPIFWGMLALVALLGGVGYWSVQARIAGAVIAPGMIQVQSNRQVVQHPEGGVVGELLVKDGDKVQAGDVLLRFDDTLLRTELAIVDAQLFEYLAREMRLEAERDGQENFPEVSGMLADAVDDPEVQDLVDGQRRLFESRATSLAQREEQIAEQIAQAENQIDGANAQLSALETQETLIQSELFDSQQLFDKGLAPISRVLALQREQARLLGEIGELNATVAQLRGQIAEFEVTRIAQRTNLRQEAITVLRDVQVQVNALIQQRLRAEERLSRMEVRAPVSGVIYGSRVFALQAVISPAEPVMYVIPQDQPMLVSARLDPIHVDQVHVGQEASLRFSALDQRMTPEIFGLVTKISADVFTDEVTGMSYYSVELMPQEEELVKLDGQALLPGMPVEAFIMTAERSPLNYLAKPLTDYFVRAFRET